MVPPIKQPSGFIHPGLTLRDSRFFCYPRGGIHPKSDMKLYFFESQCPALKDAEIVEKTLINIWLVVPTPLKNISQLGWSFPIYGKIKAMFQTTNECMISLQTTLIGDSIFALEPSDQNVSVHCNVVCKMVHFSPLGLNYLQDWNHLRFTFIRVSKWISSP